MNFSPWLGLFLVWTFEHSIQEPQQLDDYNTYNPYLPVLYLKYRRDLQYWLILNSIFIQCHACGAGPNLTLNDQKGKYWVMFLGS